MCFIMGVTAQHCLGGVCVCTHVYVHGCTIVYACMCMCGDKRRSGDPALYLRPIFLRNDHSLNLGLAILPLDSDWLVKKT